MKTKQFMYLALGGIMLLSCEKNDPLTPGNLNDQKDFTNAVEEELRIETTVRMETEAAIAELTKFMAFADASKMTSKGVASTLSDEDKSIDEAIFYLESSLNFKFFEEIGAIVNFETVRFEEELPVYLDGDDNEKVAMENLADAFSAFSTNTLESFPSGYQFVVGDVWVSYLDENSAVFQYEITYGEEANYTIQPLSSADEWFPADDDGKCNSTEIGRDAADRLRELINWYKPEGWNDGVNPAGGAVIACQPLSGFWTNVTSINNTVFIDDCRCNCLDQSDMNNEMGIFFTYMANWTPIGSRFIYADIQSSLNTNFNCGGYCSSGTNYKSRLRNNYKHGVLNCGPLPD